MTQPSLPGLLPVSAAERALCRLEALPEGVPVGLPAAPGSLCGLLAVRLGADVRVFVNACPHLGLGLDRPIGRFDAAGGVVACAAHGARFRLGDGLCLSGPCAGAALERVAHAVRDGWVVVAALAGV